MRISISRLFNISLAVPGLVASIPAIGVIAVPMAIANKGNPFFRQERVGKDGVPFTIIKIKTMRDEFDEAGQPLPDKQRTTWLGHLVRQSKLDELPQFLHVISGKMNMVGPRPITNDLSIAYDPVRILVKPGITGIGQLKGLNTAIRQQEWLETDTQYIKGRAKRTTMENLAYDLGVVVGTPIAIVRTWDISLPSLRAREPV